jgi:hypothetical protein
LERHGHHRGDDVARGRALGLAGPRRPWLWALGVGIWIPTLALIRAPSPATVAMLIVLVFPFAGAYLGMALRRAITAVLP